MYQVLICNLKSIFFFQTYSNYFPQIFSSKVNDYWSWEIYSEYLNLELYFHSFIFINATSNYVLFLYKLRNSLWPVTNARYNEIPKQLFLHLFCLQGHFPVGNT